MQNLLNRYVYFLCFPKTCYSGYFVTLTFVNSLKGLQVYLCTFVADWLQNIEKMYGENVWRN